MRLIRSTCSSWCAAVLVVVCCCAAAARGGERKTTYDLRYRPAVGQRWAYELSSDMTLNFDAAASRANVTQRSSRVTHTQVIVTSDEILEVDAGGRACVAKRVAFGKGCFAFEQDDERPRRDRSVGYPGKTVTFRVLDDETVDQDFGVKPNPRQVRELRDLILGRSDVFPTHPVAVGDRWRADDVLREMMQLGPNDTISSIFTLKAVRDRDGRQVADVAVTAGVIMKSSGINIEIGLEGMFIVDVATGVTLKGDVTGHCDATGSAHKGAVVVSGTGTYEWHRAARLLPPPAPETALTE